MPVKPNILLVVLDDLVAADLTPERAPQWTDLCALGRRYSRAYSMPVCSQSRACIEFGRYGRSLGITQAMSATEGPEPPSSAPALAAILKDRGYSTCLVGKWHLGRNPFEPLAGYLGAPQARGYDHWYAGTPDNLDSYSSWLRVDDDALTQETTYATIALERAARLWWETAAYPKFLTVRLHAPHGPMHEPPATLLGGYTPDPSLPVQRQRYEKMIRSADWFLGQLRTFSGIASTTLVCVVSDNGTPEQVPGPSQDPDRLKTTTYEDGCRIAMTWYGPPAVVPGVDDRLVHLVDIPSTIVEAAGGTVPPSWDGVGLLSALGGTPGTLRDWAISEATLADGTLERAVVTQTHKLRRTGTEAEELYGLVSDPLEAINLVADPSLAGLLSELRSILYA